MLNVLNSMKVVAVLNAKTPFTYQQKDKQLSEKALTKDKIFLIKAAPVLDHV